MISANQRSALAALDAARPFIARLDAVGHPEEIAADLIESWSAVETALRSLVGGSALGGQALIGDLRARNLLNLNQAHALLEFLAARDRASRAEYQPNEGDVTAARSGFQTLETALGVGIAADTAMFPAVPTPRGGSPAAQRPTPEPRGGPYIGSATGPMQAATHETPPPYPDEPPTTARSGRQPWFFLAAVVLGALIAIGSVVWLLTGAQAGERAIARGRDAYRDGRREVARREFEEGARREPKRAEPHVYLARLAREDGDLPRAQRELETAIRLEANNHLALREMGQLLIQANRPDLAVRFLTRAIEANGKDSAAMGWLGCALVRQGRPDLAQSWFQRAGSGGWTACAAPTVPPGAMIPPPGTMPQPGAAPQAGAQRPF